MLPSGSLEVSTLPSCLTDVDSHNSGSEQSDQCRRTTWINGSRRLLSLKCIVPGRRPLSRLLRTSLFVCICYFAATPCICSHPVWRH